MTDRTFPCSTCGAELQFEPGAGALRCPYCGVETAMPRVDAPVRELDYRAFLATAAFAAANEGTVETLTIKCESCGAESTQPPNVTSGACAFCGANIVSTGRSTRRLKPKALLPFQVDQKRAREAFRGWVRRLWFAPNALKHFARQDSPLTGMYVPYWTYDCDATTHYTGQRGDDYWTTETYTTTVNGRRVTRTRQVRRTRWTSVSGTVFNRFDDVLVMASRSLPDKYARALEPWDLQHLQPYQDAYLSGFRAESYQIDLPDGFERAKEIMADAIHATICRDIGGDHQRVSSATTSYEHITFKHLLLPVWLSAYRYRGKTYRFLVNARTGEVQGERPYSWLKIALAILAALPIVAALVYFIVFLDEGGVPWHVDF